jgi:hypothetical protein
MLLATGSYSVEALSVEVDEMFGIVFGTRHGAALEAGARGSGTAKAGCSGDELHHFECDFLIAAQRWHSRDGSNGNIAHGNSPGLN